MRKEVVVAIIVGAFVGVAVAFGVWRANKAFLPQERTKLSSSRPQASPSSEKTNSWLLITSPESGSVFSEDTIKVEGTATPYATIVVTTNSGEIISAAKANGAFLEDVKLVGGPNEIKVAAYDKEGNKSEQTLVVVYSTEFPKKEQ